MKILDARAFNQSISATEKYLELLSEQIKQTKAAVKGIISLEDSLKGKTGQAIRSFYQECHLSFLLYFESFIKDYEAILTSIKNQLKNFEPDPNGVISESFLEHDVRSGLNKIETTAIGIVHEANEAMKKVRDIIDLPDLDETHLVESIRQAKRYSNHTIEQLHAFDKAQTAALETVEHDIALMENYINQIGTAIKSGEVNLSNYSVKQITSCESYNDLIGDLAQKTNPYENKYRRPDEDEQLIAASYIGELQNKNLTKEEFETLKGKVETVHILDELDEYDGDYHIYANGMIVREYKDEHFNIRYEFVDKIRKKRTGRAEGQDSLFEGTPLELIEYAVPGGLIKTGATKLGKKAITGIEKKLVKEFSGDAGNTAANDIISNIPSNAIKRDLTPTDNIKEGVEYKWNDGGATWRVRIHSKDLSAPNGSNASKGWIMRVQRGKWFMDSQGNWHKRNLLSPNSPFFDEKIADQTHIPIKKLR